MQRRARFTAATRAATKLHNHTKKPRKIAPSGCYDTKASSVKWFYDGRKALVVSGPTVNKEIPVFEWANGFSHLPHKGLPEKYNFKPQVMQPHLVDVVRVSVGSDGSIGKKLVEENNENNSEQGSEIIML